jgi:hypothetical protein
LIFDSGNKSESDDSIGIDYKFILSKFNLSNRVNL